MKICPQPLRQYLDHLGSLLLEFRGDRERLLNGATCDSREVRPGWLFLAVHGHRQDGAQYLQQALASGAVAVAADHALDLPPEVAFLRITEPYPAAARLAETMHEYPARRLRLLGVTGTNGKTTSVYLLRDILAAAGRRPGMIGTVEYDLGERHLEADRTTPPAFLLQELFREMTEHAVQDVAIEVSSHALDQRRPGTSRFAGAIFTNLTGDHADYHRTMENYFAAKRVLFTEYLEAGAPAVVNIDDFWGKRLARELQAANPALNLITFGLAAGARARLIQSETTVRGSRLTIGLDGRQYRFESPLIGAFNGYNIGEVATLALSLGLGEDGVRRAVAACRGAPGRLEAVRTATGIVAFVDYAHSDDALRNVLQTLRLLQPRRLLVVFGCGGDRDRSKRPRMGRIAAELADRVYLTSDNPRTEDPQAILAEIRAGVPAGRDVLEKPDRREAIRLAVAEARPGDILLIAGKGHETYQEVNGVKTHFHDVEEVQSAFLSRGLLTV